MTEPASEELDSLFDVTLPPRPYPGLRPFEQHEWPIFFGRERMADEVMGRLLDQRLIVVHGDSGCGKSSLIRAAVLPRLEHECARGGLRWRTCAMLPREGPLAGLARALAGIGGDEGRETRRFEFRRVLNFGRDAAPAVAGLLARDATAPVCVLVDQFEELFEHARRHGPEEAGLLTDLLVGLFERQPPGLYCVLTMRSEFLGGCARFRGFAETVNRTQYLLPRMAHADLVRAIREPALLYDGEVTPDLAERLIADAGGGQDQLPLIQHGLMLLHREKTSALGVDAAATGPAGPAAGVRWRLSTADYAAETGLGGLLSAHADAVADEAEREHLAGRPEPRAIEDLFRALTEINPDGQAVRRPRRLSELVRVTGVSETELHGVVDAFRADGVSFLTPYGSEPLQGDPLVDIGHEALIRRWQRLADAEDGWLQREFRNGLVWRSLLVQADSFDRNPDNVLSPATTEERVKWLARRNEAWAERYGGGWARVVRLVEASVARREHELREEEEGRQRQEQAKLRDQELVAERQAAAEREKRLRVLRRSSAVMMVLLLLACALGVLAWYQARRANAEAQEADRHAREAEAQKAMAEAARDRAVAEAEEAKLQFSTAQALREDAEERAQAVEKSADALREIGVLIRQAGVASPEAYDTLALARRRLEEQARALDTAGTDDPLPDLPLEVEPRVYLHIVDEAQREVARGLQRVLEKVVLDGKRVDVPGIQLVQHGPRRNELRCFTPENCARDAPRIETALRDALEGHDLAIVDLSARYGGSGQVQPGTYEIWLGPEVSKVRARIQSLLPRVHAPGRQQAPSQREEPSQRQAPVQQVPPDAS